MLKIVSIIGARPQIIKAAALSRAIRRHFSDQIREIVIHTGQHYDNNMSQVFIDELGGTTPSYTLKVGSASHGKQTGRMIERIEEVLLEEDPNFLIVYGDTNSTLAASVAASKLGIPIVHIEAGLRSFNKSMPEEINRIMCDHASTLLFTPTKTGINNLLREGLSIKNEAPFTADHPGIFHCGDVMYDNHLYFKHLAKKKSTILAGLDIEDKPFILGTIHRPNNTDQPERLKAIFSALNKITIDNQISAILPLHPRAERAMEKNMDAAFRNEIDQNPFIKIISPVSFFDIIMLEGQCKMVITDSGGLQKEAYFSEKPCIILRQETEWKEIVEAGTGIVTDADEQRITDAFRHFNSLDGKLIFPPIFGDGFASEFICETMLA